jgi:4-amino-4-deoxy-L-arabinose transferase-like glycosyltransferase
VTQLLSKPASEQALPLPPRALTRADGLALLALAVLFGAMLIASWQRWTQPLVDHGREMNLPARLVAGEQLYTDVQFLYGPLAPYLNATLYRLFGVHLSTLHASGAICALLILALIYWLARRLMNVWEAALTTALVLVICALKSTANYIQPYAYAALYALVLALASLVATLSYVQGRRARWWLLSGVCAGLALISKPEVALAALMAAGIALLIQSLSERRLLWRESLYFALPVVSIAAIVYSFILWRVPLSVLLHDNHVLFTSMPTQLVYFNRHISGLAYWPASLWFSLTGIAMFGIWAAGSAALGALFSMRTRKGWGATLKLSSLVLITGLLWRLAAGVLLPEPRDITPFASAVFVLPLIIGVLGWRVWQAHRAQQTIALTERVLLIIAVFSLVSILRAFLNVTTTGPYTPFFIPTLIIVYLYLLFRVAPAFFAPPLDLRRNVRRTAMVLIALLVIGMAINSARRLRRSNTFTVGTARGSFITEPEWGAPMAAAIRYAMATTQPGDYVLTLPQATTINFLAARPYPFREEIVHPGFLADAKELEAIERIKARRVPLILVANLLTPEFRDRVFGADYNQELMRWITENYHVAARFDAPRRPGTKPPKEPFFILAYELNQ